MSPSHPTLDSRIRTILLVEDDDQLRALFREVLRVSGYHVLEARLNSLAALLFGQHAGQIDLMLNDLMMPGTIGYHLATRLRAWRPEMKVLFMSGLPKETLETERLLEPGALFLQKPFDGSTLIKKVREVLQIIRPASLPPKAAPIEPHNDLVKEVGTMQATLSTLAQAIQRLTQQLNSGPSELRYAKPPVHSKRHRLRARRRTFLTPREEDRP